MIGTMDGLTYRALKAAGVPDDQAEAAAHAVARPLGSHYSAAWRIGSCSSPIAS